MITEDDLKKSRTITNTMIYILFVTELYENLKDISYNEDTIDIHLDVMDELLKLLNQIPPVDTMEATMACFYPDESVISPANTEQFISLIYNVLDNDTISNILDQFLNKLCDSQRCYWDTYDFIKSLFHIDD